MKAPAHYFTLKAAALPRIEAYHRDLLVHDRRELRRKPTCPFLHLTRQYGTYLTMLIPSTDYPPQGVEVPYLFGHADRWHILKERAGCMEYGRKHHPNALLHYFDGKNLRTITYDQASEIIRQYTSRISSEFRKNIQTLAA